MGQIFDIDVRDFEKHLAANFEVVSSIENPKLPGSGFDAVIWRVKADSPLAVYFPRCLSKSRHSRLLVAHAAGSTSA
ncbi:hypothetical protein AAHN93_07155 [Vandammella animalimorsus]|uniref:Uncharacterized protein n=1 Tax=Vandammella animalimorsus TaxID=2029117 RepID=A0A2A2B274_9BURK|nr:hypothetical protein [Vandammella animalimorsus]PAT44174.1 hypothetical protein CK621_00930 [Vandammella animalimorsus]